MKKIFVSLTIFASFMVASDYSADEFQAFDVKNVSEGNVHVDGTGTHDPYDDRESDLL